MITKEANYKKYGCFYASNFHLEMILLPSIRKNLDKTKFMIFTEEDLSDSIKTVLDRTNFESNEKEKILNLNWKEKKVEYCSECDLNEHTIIINGKSEYISEVNKKIKNLDIKNVNIIDCYNVYEQGLKIVELQQKYDSILNTKNINR